MLPGQQQQLQQLGFWDDFSKGFKQGLQIGNQIVQTAAPIVDSVTGDNTFSQAAGVTNQVV